jgi:hypothetical protein
MIIPIIFHMIFDYFRGIRPNLQELADANSRPMRRAMTDKWPVAPAALRDSDEVESLLYQNKSTYLGEWRLLYALIVLLHLLFCRSGQDWAAGNLNLRKVSRHTKILWEVSCHGTQVKKQALLAVMWAQFTPFSFELFASCIISKLENAIWVRIHCRKLANWHIHHRGSVSLSIQAKSINSSTSQESAKCLLPQRVLQEPPHQDRSCGCTPVHQHAMQI